MLTLGLDTTAGTASAAILSDEKLLCEYTLNSGNTHSQTLLPMIENMLGHRFVCLRCGAGLLYRRAHRCGYSERIGGAI